ncbi:MAG: UDP-N-acetylmuramoyl-tripeptide--D-alanyl-D-alanine ligase [Mariprofundaceae bacterium]
MRLSSLEIQQATGGIWHYDEPDSINMIQTDSRNFQAGSTFLALRGPSFDGHLFADQLSHKAQALIGDQQGLKLWKDYSIPKLEVTDTLQALGNIAHAWRTHLQHTTVIAITGSYGKTTVRSMLLHLFQGLGLKVASTQDNLNNLIGVPETLLGAPENSDIALIECGISEAGEMAQLGAIVEPDIAIITGLSHAHSEGLKGLSGIIKEKYSLLEHLSSQGWYALGEGAQKQPQPLNCKGKPLDHYVEWDMQGCLLTLKNQDESVSIKLELPAQHWGENMALVASIALEYCRGKDVSIKQLGSILESWKPVAGRLKTEVGINQAHILNDCYNANPASMQAALYTLANLPEQRIAILGDMAELGDEADAAHSNLDVTHINQLILIGSHMKDLHKKHKDSIWIETTEQAVSYINTWKKNINSTDSILIKGSRSMHLERIVKILSIQGESHAV